MSGNGWNFGELAFSKTSVLESSFIRNSTTTRAVPREPFNRNDSIRESRLACKHVPPCTLRLNFLIKCIRRICYVVREDRLILSVHGDNKNEKGKEI